MFWEDYHQHEQIMQESFIFVSHRTCFLQ